MTGDRRRATKVVAMACGLVALLAVSSSCGGKSTNATGPSGGTSSLLIVTMQPLRTGAIGPCNQFQLWVTATDALANPVTIDSTLWTSSDSTSISVTPRGGLLTSHHATPSITIDVTAWSGTKSGAATGLWLASNEAVTILDPNGNPYPEPPCP